MAGYQKISGVINNKLVGSTQDQSNALFMHGDANWQIYKLNRAITQAQEAIEIMRVARDEIGNGVKSQDLDIVIP